MITKRRKILAIAVVLAMSAFWEIYLLRIQSSGVFLWSHDQAYFFVTVVSRGHHLSALGWPWLAIKESLGAVGDRSDDRGTLVVIRVTAAGVEKHTLELERTPEGVLDDPSRITPLEDRIYALCGTGILSSFVGMCRWESGHFVQASKQEKDKFHKSPESSLLTRDDFENDGHGWSRTILSAGGPLASVSAERQLATIVGDGLQLSIDCTGGGGTGAMSIYLQRLGKPIERIGYFEGLDGGIVSKARYLRTFEIHK